MIKVHRDIEINTPDVLDPRVMAINLKVHGFNIRVVNGCSPTNCDGSEYQKETFYRLLTKSSIKDQKHQKVIVTGDFNAETGLAKYKSCYDGESLIQDNECNDNGCRLKSFYKSQKLCISSSFFDYTMIDRYTWYSNDKKTKKINDYVLTGKYVQQYVTQCIVMRDYNFDSDHRLLKTTLTTPCTRKARRTTKKQTNKLLPDIKTLHNPNIEVTYTATVNRKLRENATLYQTPSDIAENLVQILDSTASETLPKKSKSKSSCELWKDDTVLNDLLKRRTQSDIQSLEHKIISKKIKKGVEYLRNEKLRIEAEEINYYASKRQVEEVYRTIKAAQSEKLIEKMVRLYSLVWRTHQIPKFWGHSKLVALWKGSAKGKIDDPKSHRALQIGSTFCKILVIIIIINRIKNWYDCQLLDQQQGFRSGRGTADGIFYNKTRSTNNRPNEKAYIFAIC